MKGAARNIILWAVLLGLACAALLIFRPDHNNTGAEKKVVRVGLNRTPLIVTGVIESLDDVKGYVVILVGTPAKRRTIVVAPSTISRLKLKKYDIIKARVLWQDDKAQSVEVVKPAKKAKKPAAPKKK